MKYLLWETSGVPWGLALVDDTGGEMQMVAMHEDGGARTLAANLMGAVDEVLSSANCPLKDIAGFAVSLGPGSWTGLRIGLTAAKTMAQSLSLPIMGIATFDVFAEALPQHDVHDKLLLVRAPCRPGELYAKLWHCHDAERDLLEAEWIGSHQQIGAKLLDWSTKLDVQEVAAVGPDLKDAQGFHQQVPLSLTCHKSTFKQHLRALGTLALGRTEKQQWDDALTMQPIYLAPSAAEREYHAKHSKLQ